MSAFLAGFLAIGRICLMVAGGVYLAHLAAQWLERRDDVQIPPSDEPIFDQLCAEMARRESRFLDTELWLFTRNRG